MYIKMEEIRKIISTKGSFGGNIFYVITKNNLMYQLKQSRAYDMQIGEWVICPNWFENINDINFNGEALMTYADSDVSCLYIKKKSTGKPWMKLKAYSIMNNKFTKENIEKFVNHCMMRFN